MARKMELIYTRAGIIYRCTNCSQMLQIDEADGHRCEGENEVANV